MCVLVLGYIVEKQKVLKTRRFQSNVQKKYLKNLVIYVRETLLHVRMSQVLVNNREKNTTPLVRSYEDE
jgi:hypothetical protein